MSDGEVTLQLVCTRLPGICFSDSHTEPPTVYQPVFLGIQKGKEVVDAVPADRQKQSSPPYCEPRVCREAK